MVLCGGSEKDLNVMVWPFVEVCRRRGLKVNADKSKVVVLGGEKELGRDWSKYLGLMKVLSIVLALLK